MSGRESGPLVGHVAAALDTLAATDMSELDDAALREQLLELAAVANRVHAELIRRVDAFDRRGLSIPDGFRTAKAWLQAWCRLSGVVAHRLVKAARLLRSLPKLAEVVQTGDVSGEHLQQVVWLADQIGPDHVAEVEPTLADAAPVLDLSQFTMLTERVRAHVDPDGSDPAAAFDRRGLSLSPVGGMVNLRGQLDPEGGAALMSALDAVMTPPGPGDVRTAAQRRADALVELARRPLAAGNLPTVGGQRPQVGVLVWPQALSAQVLAKLAERQRDSFAAQRLRQFLADTADSGDSGDSDDTADVGDSGDSGDSHPDASGIDWIRPDIEAPATAHTSDSETRTQDQPEPAKAGAGAEKAKASSPQTGSAEGSSEEASSAERTAATTGTETTYTEPASPEAGGPETDIADPRAPVARPTAPPDRPVRPARAETRPTPPGRLPPTWSDSGWADPPHLNWFGAISHHTAQRIACDADFFRIILDPATGMPLDVGRTHRLVPYWIRRALYTRDRGCRWTGCAVPAEWADAHHLDPWVNHGETKVERCLLLCRYHHVQVHEGGWGIDLDPGTGGVHITRPDGTAYLIPHTRSTSWNGPTTQVV